MTSIHRQVVSKHKVVILTADAYTPAGRYYSRKAVECAVQEFLRRDTKALLVMPDESPHPIGSAIGICEELELKGDSVVASVQMFVPFDWSKLDLRPIGYGTVQRAGQIEVVADDYVITGLLPARKVA